MGPDAQVLTWDTLGKAEGESTEQIPIYASRLCPGLWPQATSQPQPAGLRALLMNLTGIHGAPASPAIAVDGKDTVVSKAPKPFQSSQRELKLISHMRIYLLTNTS